MNTTATLPLGRLAYYEQQEVLRIAANLRPRVRMAGPGTYFRPADVPANQRARFLAALKGRCYAVMVAVEPGMAVVVHEHYRHDFEQVVLGLEDRVAEIAATGRRGRAAALAARAAALRARLADPFALAPASAEPAAP